LATGQRHSATVKLHKDLSDDSFERRIFIPLPDAQARTKMFELNVGETPNNVTHKEFKQLGDMTEGYSGSDIAIAVRDALMEPIRKLRMATHFKPVLLSAWFH